MSPLVVGCNAPSSSEVQFGGNPTKAKVSWSASSGALRYQIRYQESGTGIWITRSALNPTKILSNLLAGTTYLYEIRTRCTSSGWTNWTATESFTTSSNGEALDFTLDNVIGEQSNSVNQILKLYPNPTTNELNVLLDIENTETEGLIIVSDFMGKVLMQDQIDLSVKGTQHLTLDVSNLPVGAYVLQINSSDSNEVYKFVKM